MLSLSTKFAKWTMCSTRCRAVLVGTCLGWIAWELSAVPERSAYNLAMALIVVMTGSASFVLFALHAQAARSHPARLDQGAETRVWVSLLGGAVALSINALQWLLA